MLSVDEIIDELGEKQKKELLRKLEIQKEKHGYENFLNAIREHNSYVGKCYKRIDSDSYIYVLSARSCNEYHVTGLCFDFPVKIEEDKKLYREFKAESAFSRVSFRGIYTKDIPMFTNPIFGWEKRYVEISKEEYYKKMREYIDELERRVESKEFAFSFDL